MNQRVLWIDFAKAFAIFGVVLIHAPITYPTRGIIYVFIIPLFFFLSGIFASPQRYPNFKTFFFKKSLRILIPYLFFNVVNWLFWLLIGRHYGVDSDSEISWWRPLLGIIYGNASMLTHYVPLWFLTCLFSTESIYYFIFRRVSSKRNKLLIICTIAAIGFINSEYNSYLLPWGINMALIMILFYGLGDVLCDSIKQRSIVIKNRWWPCIALITTPIVIASYALNNVEIEVHNNSYGNYLYFIIGALAGILAIVAIAKMLEQINIATVNRYLSYIGQNTIVLLCLHLTAFSFIKAFVFFVLKLPMAIFQNTYISIIQSINTILILLPVIWFMNRYMPLFIGKQRNIKPLF